MYIKHNWDYYKKINLNDLDKKELIKLIENAVQVENKIIRTVEHVYDRRWYNQPYINTYCNWTTLTNSASNNLNTLTCNTSALNNMDTSALRSVAMSIN